jgi:beta-lactamase class A
LYQPVQLALGKRQMKSSWLFLGLTGIVLLNFPANAVTKSESPQVQESDTNANQNQLNQIGNSNSFPQLQPLPDIKFTPPQPEIVPQNPLPSDSSDFAGVIHLGKEISGLNSQIRALMKRYSYLSPGMFFLDLQTGDYLNINGEKVFSAASTIKFPIMIALFQEVEAGRVRLDETLVMRRDLVAGGSGNMQNKRAGSKFSLLETATQMMTMSDNTATNMIIDRLGGFAVLNQRFHSWGLKNTELHHLLADEYGKNTTSAKDLVQLSALVASNKLINNASSNKVLEIMRHCHNTSMLPSGLGAGAVIAHKTGTLRFVLGDAGIIQTPSGKRYLAGIMVKRPNHDDRATDFIRQVSRSVYNYFEHPQLTKLP